MDNFDDDSGSSAAARNRTSEHDTIRLDAGRLGAGRPGPAEQPGGSDDDAEARMRQALGLFRQRPSQAEPVGERRQGGGHMQVGARRHRFVQDGEVPVSVVRGRRDQVAASLASPPRSDLRDRLLDEQMAERAGREQAERRLGEAQALIRTLQTRLGHAELERDEAVAETRSLREQMLAERASSEDLQARLAQIEQAQAERAQAERGHERVSTKVEPALDDENGTDHEPEPVKWWL